MLAIKETDMVSRKLTTQVYGNLEIENYFVL